MNSGNSMKRRTLLLAAGASAAVLSHAPALAQDAYPSKPVRIVVPFAAGTSPDAVARILGAQMSKSWGQQVVVENRPGAAGMIGAEAAARSPADGYTLLLTVTSVMAINPHVYTTLRYNPLSDFTAVSQILGVAYVLTVPPNAPYGTMKELVAAAKANPGGLSYGSFGIGSQPHVVTESWSRRLGIKMNHVPYSGSPATDLMSGVLSLLMDPATTAVPLVQAKKVKAIAVTSERRIEALPDVPTTGEFMPGLETSAWHGVFVPRATPPDVVARISAELVRVVHLPEVQTRLKELGLTPVGSGTAEFTSKMRSDYAAWGRTIRELGIKLE